MWSVGPSSICRFSQRSIKRQVEANEAAFEATSATYRKTVLTAVADVEVALTRLARSEDRRRQLLDAETQQRGWRP